MNIRTVTATRYVTPLREGGSLPAVVETDDDGLYVLKFRGAGQGTNALTAELLVGELARIAGLDVPEIVFIRLDPALAQTEPDPEIQDLIRASGGLNLGLDYLPGSVGFDPAAAAVGAEAASSLVWFDAFTMNVDRTARNTNMLIWHKKLYLIDHGSALYFHHAGGDYSARARDPFKLIREHVLLGQAEALPMADARMSARISSDAIAGVAGLLPDSWLEDPAGPAPDCRRAAYAGFLTERLNESHVFMEEAIRARESL